MKSLVRQHFLDQTWDDAHLDDAAKFWLQLYGIAAGRYGYSQTLSHGLEIRLSGFPRTERELLGTELERRASGSDLLNPVVTFPDLDTLAVSSGPSPEAPPDGLGLSLLSGPAFEGLVAEFRFQVIGWRRLRRVRISLVIVGELCKGKLLLKAAWRSYGGWEQEEDTHYRQTSIAGEGEWLQALDTFRRSGEVTKQFAVWMTPPTSGDRWRRIRSKLVWTPFGRPRLLGLLARFLLFTGIPATGAYFWFLVEGLSRTPWGWPALLGMVLGLALLLPFLATEAGFLFSFRTYRRQHAQQFAETTRYLILPPERTEALDRDPAVRKYTADLKAEGFLFTGDVEAPGAGTTYRIFRAPDGVTYLILMFSRALGNDPATWNRVWPAYVSLQAQTFFKGGGRVDSTPGTHYGALKYPPDPTILIRMFPHVTDPLQFYWRHTAATEAFAAEMGLTPARHVRIEDYVRLQEAISDEECAYYQVHPYSLGDHLRWYLQWPRREQRG